MVNDGCGSWNIRPYPPQTASYLPHADSLYPFPLPEYRNALVIYSNAVDIYLM